MRICYYHTQHGSTALHLAVKNGNDHETNAVEEVVRKLLEFGADENIANLLGHIPADSARMKGYTKVYGAFSEVVYKSNIYLNC